MEVEFVAVDNIMNRQLNRAALDILGANSAPINPSGEAIQKDLALQWGSILSSGLSQEVIQALERKYSIPINLQSAKPPRLNPELRAPSVSETALARDSRLESEQRILAVALSALGRSQSLLLILQTEEGGGKLLPAIEALNDGAKLLAEVHHRESLSRQNLISLGLDKGVRDLVQGTSLDGWLFGENLSDRFKAAKALEKSSIELKGSKKPSTSRGGPQTNPKNRSAPLRSRSNLGGRKQYQQSGSKRFNQQHQPRKRQSFNNQDKNQRQYYR